MYELPNGNDYGGVAIYVNHDLKVSERDDLKLLKTCKCSKCSFESVWIDVIKHNETFTIGGMYRHPGGNTAHFNTAVEVTLSKLNKNDSCIMTGDVNINLLNIDGTITTDYISSVMSHGFVPYITRPTRITEYTATLIDHLFVRLPRHKMTAPVKAGILFNDITDHLPIFLYLSVQSKCQRNQRPRVRIFSDTNIQKFVDKIASVNWLHILNHHCSNLNCTEFYKHIKRFYSDSFPLVQVSRKRSKDKPWITRGVLIGIRHKIDYIAKVYPNQQYLIPWNTWNIKKSLMHVLNMQKSLIINKVWVTGIIQQKTCGNILGRYLTVTRNVNVIYPPCKLMGKK